MMTTEDFGKKVESLLEDINDLRSQVCGLVDQSQEDFAQSSLALESLAGKSTALSQSSENIRLSAMSTTLPHLMRTSKEHKVLATQLEQLGMVQNTLEDIIEIHKWLINLEDALSNNDIWKAVKITSNIRQLIPNVNVRKEDIRVFEALRITFIELKDRVRASLEEEWLSAVTFEEEIEDETNTFSIGRSPSKMQQLITSLEVIGEARTKVSKTVQHIVQSVLLPLVRGATETTLKLEVNGIVVLSRKLSDLKPVPPMKLFDQLTKLFGELCRHLLSLRIDERGEEKVMDITRFMMADPLISSIIESSLSQSLPSSQEELVTYSEEVVPKCRQFEEQLQKWGIIDASAHQLSDYVSEIDKLFLEKKKEVIFVKGRELMKQSLFDISPVGEESCESEPGDEKSLTFFPRCLVSRSLIALIAFLDESIEDGLASSSEEYKGQVYEAILGVIDLYPRIVTTVHKAELEEVPQAAAIFHCNCMFLSQRCLFDFRLAQLVPRAYFAHLVKYLRGEANDVLLSQLHRQRDQMDEILSSLGDLSDAASRGERLLGVLRQECRQMGVLSRVWRVLPKHVFAQVMGTIIDHVCSYLIRNICAITDISTDDCDTLLELLVLVRENCLDLYKVPESEDVPQIYKFADDSSALSLHVARCVRSWTRLNELIFVLESNLREISERWASGKGPLADAFTVPEMKSLIRALFQNTEKRAAVLAKIR